MFDKKQKDNINFNISTKVLNGLSAEEIYDTDRKLFEDHFGAEATAHFDLYKLHCKAYDAEKAGNYDKAMKIYLRNIQRHPQGTVYYERPAIMLEKLAYYSEAIEVCKLCIRRIEAGDFRADPQEFQKRIDRMEKKLQAQTKSKKL